MLRTFTLCCVGRVFFRARSLGAALSYFRAMLTLDFSFKALVEPRNYAMSADHLVMSLISVLVLFAVDAAQERAPLRETLSRRSLVLRWALIFACLFAIIVFGMYGHGYGSTFIYEQF